uniref:(northern house mosquito) hypothetical protein n=2 Tax=Culex pipiens TaxID=7175 RepID=A0A8D8D9E0_CULPI
MPLSAVSVVPAVCKNIVHRVNRCAIMGNSICHNWRFRRPRWSTIPAGSAHSCSKLWRVPDITHNITKADRNASSWLTVSERRMGQLRWRFHESNRRTSEDCTGNHFDPCWIGDGPSRIQKSVRHHPKIRTYTLDMRVCTHWCPNALSS